MKGKVLIVDDDPKIGRFLKFKLSKADFEAEYYSSGRDALKRIPELKPHLIISDIQMPLMNGYEFCEKLRQDARTANIPFIFLSGRTDTSDQLEGLRLGADDYVCKPVKIDFLLERMGKVLERAAKARTFKSQADFSGHLSQMNLNDAMQIVESNHKSGELEFSTSEGKTIGRILFNKGNLVKAQFGALEGAEAFYGLMDEEEGFFEFFGRTVDEPEQIKITNMAALLQGSRLIDEAKGLYKLLPNQDVLLVTNSKQAPPETEDRYGSDKIQKILWMVEKRFTANEIINSGKMSRPRAASILSDLLKKNIVLVQEEPDREEPEALQEPRLLIEDWLIKVLQNIDARKMTGVLEIGNRPVKETIFFQDGRVVNAFHGRTSGKKALYRIFSERGGAPKFQIIPVVVNQVISDDLDYLLEDGNWEVKTLRGLRRISFNNMISINPQNLDKVTRIKNRPGLKEVLTLVQQHGRVQEVIDASQITDMRTYNHLLTLVKLGAINIEKGSGKAKPQRTPESSS
ncbi:MAG: response regulator [Thermodesulfobacteriota bacterium]